MGGTRRWLPRSGITMCNKIRTNMVVSVSVISFSVVMVLNLVAKALADTGGGGGHLHARQYRRKQTHFTRS